MDGACLVADGPRSHLFYNGPIRGADFRNFELEVEANAVHAANSGIYFHTRYQESDFPQKGFEIQICNSLTGKETYQPRKKTGSLYGLRNVYKPFAADDQWFKINVLVRGKNIQVRLNGFLLVDYTEPSTPYIPDGLEKERFLDHGTFALQCHDEPSRTRFRRVRVRPLPDDLPTPGPVPVADDLFKQIIDVGRHNIPMADFHVHLKAGLTLEQALTRSRRDGIHYGIAVNCGKGFPTETDDGVRAYFESMKGAPVFVAMQAEGREWTQMFSRGAAGLFDYVFTDSMTWTDNRGKRMRTWIPSEVGAIPDPQEFMDTLVDRAVGILNQEPVDIYVNPTLPPRCPPAQLRIALDRNTAEESNCRARKERRGHGNQRPLQAAKPIVYPDGQGERSQIHLRYQQRFYRGSAPLRLRPADGRGMPARLAGFLCAG